MYNIIRVLPLVNVMSIAIRRGDEADGIFVRSNFEIRHVLPTNG